MPRVVLLVLLAVLVASCSKAVAPLDPASPPPSEAAPPAVLFVASEASEGLFVEVACAGSYEGEQCMEAVPLEASLTLVNGSTLPIAGPATLDSPSCGGSTIALEAVEPGMGWAVWPSDVALLEAPGSGVSAEARHADKAEIARALAQQEEPLPASVTKLVAAIDLDGDRMDDRVYRLGDDADLSGEGHALAILATGDPSRVTFVDGEDGGAMALQGVVDLDGDGSYELLLLERWSGGFEYLVAGLGVPEIEVYGAWGCTLSSKGGVEDGGALPQNGPPAQEAGPESEPLSPQK